ncbi:non-ribosomal peptide synthetase [Streptomyces sp. NBC_00083]|uniref:non-ribosomal peptide synthetase n=1 Tax=Streptomyces sp. NBC_00083 TaxID=2975647 RepID=UPI00225B3E01|nr:non-ribosomal peptide synthetase [Streptomyces sp. NBC_00083]MCX5384762.1 amino acid adenylation domain-containing protein [Streptomyces sp. NBC_00083]
MRRAVADLLEEPVASILDDDDLVARGLDSMGIMRLAGQWRREGVAVTFGELIEQPRLCDWWRLATGRAGGPDGDKPRDTAAVLDDAYTELDERAPFPLAPMQYAYWIGRAPGQALGSGSHFYFEFDGPALDPDRLDAALRSLTARHPMLRARFLDDGTQRIDESPTGLAGVHDLRALAPAEAEAELARLRGVLSHQRMDAARGQVLDVRVSLLPGGAGRLHIDIDMLVCDAMSFRIVIADLAHHYDHPEEHPEPAAYSYRRYLAERSARPAEGRERDRAHWASRLAALPSGPQLPLAVAPEQVRDARTTRRGHLLDAAERARLLALSRAHGVSPSMALAACYAQVLALWSAEERFLLNLPLFDRDPVHPDVPLLVGDFTSLLLLTVEGQEADSFAARARQVQAGFREAAAHGDYPGTEVLRDLARTRRRGALAPVVFTSALSMGELFGPEVRGVLGEPAWMSSQTPQVWMDLQVVEEADGIRLNWEAVDALFPEGTVDAMFAALCTLVSHLTAPGADWEAPLPDLLPARQRQVREAVNATARDLPVSPLHAPFFARAAADPGRAALLSRGGALSYGEVAERALRLAGSLREGGLTSGEAVLVTLPKGPDQIVAVLGVLAAGGVYVPVGVDQPAERRARIRESSGAGAEVTAATLAASASTPPLDIPASPDPAAPAYVIYTSGSTGTPKGVVVSHRAAGNTVAALGEHFSVGPDDRTLAISALDFDLSVYDIFGPLSAGGAVVCVSEPERRDARSWLALAREHAVTVVNCVPTLFAMLLEAARADGGAPSLRVALLGGDRVPVDLAEGAAEVFPGLRFAGLGGTTETAIHSTVFETDRPVLHGSCVPYGVPLANQRCRVSDPNGRDRPDWVPGELWIGGASVADGYRGDPERTADRFVTHEGLRWYRTGDLARYWPDGTLEFLGRSDFQVKIRGHRIEPGEIEAALVAHPEVTAAAVVPVGDEPRRLAAAVVPAPGAAGRHSTDGTELPQGEAELESTLRDHLAALLPAAMVPERITAVAALPLNANAKVDRAALTELLSGAPRASAAHIPPQGPVEAAVGALWEELLGTERVGRTDDFFALGGDSLLATRLLTRLKAEGLHDADLGRLFAAPTLRDFAAGLTPGRPTRLPTVTADLARRGEPFPATDVQRAYWLGRGSDFTLGGVGSYWYWEFDGQHVDLALLEDVWNRLVQRHEMMRAVFDDDGNQKILPKVPRFRLTVTDAPAGEEETALAAQRAAMDHRVFDVGSWPLFDIAATRYGAGRTRIAFGFDYIVLDALSIMTLFWELSTLYRDPRTHLPALGVSFRDYVLQAAPADDDLAADRDYWRARLDDLPPAPALPLAVDPVQVSAPRFARREFALEPDTWAALTARGREVGLTPSALLATAFADVLAAWSAHPDVTLNLTLFDRREVHPDINDIVGDFTSLLLVGHRPRAGEGWASAARRFQQQIWDGLQHSSVSAIWVLRELALRDGVMDSPMPVVFTSTLGVSDKLADLSMPFGEQVYGLSQTPQVWLDCQVVERDGGLAINWDVVEELFPDGVVADMFGAYERLLRSLCTADWAAEITVPLPAAQRAARVATNATEAPAGGGPLHRAFFARARSAPERSALLWGESGALDYGGLAARALAVAGALREAGVRPEDMVAVVLPKGPDQIAAVLGVLAAGAAYVPVGVDQPAARRDRILANAGARVALTSGTSGDWPATVRRVDVTGAFAAEPLPGPVEVSEDALAYTIFTSGSTGEPKGVEITHRAAANTVEDIGERFGVGPDDRVLAVSALDFDLSVYDIFGPLSAGGALVLIAEEDRREAHRWLGSVRDHGVTLWNTVPALLDMLLVAAGDGPALDGLRLALVSGDWVGLDLPGRLAERAPRCRLIALGGATEAAIWSNYHVVEGLLEGWPSIPYGAPLRNQRYRVADAHARDCPDWVPGELWIGGAGVAAGYRGDPARTAERFVTYAGERWYRTGDLGRYRPGAVIEFLGRADHQVKVGGHRIELGEIEAALGSAPTVARAVALTVGERPRHRIVAFVVSDTGIAPDTDTLRATLAERLPHYMIPDRIEAVERLPLTANGKVDRAALTELAAGAGAGPDRGEPPRGETEQVVAGVFGAVLETERVGRGESFFLLGGDSLTATRAAEELYRATGVRLTLRQFFAAPTVSALAALVQEQRNTTALTAMEEGTL